MIQVPLAILIRVSPSLVMIKKGHNFVIHDFLREKWWPTGRNGYCCHVFQKWHSKFCTVTALGSRLQAFNLQTTPTSTWTGSKSKSFKVHPSSSIVFAIVIPVRNYVENCSCHQCSIWFFYQQDQVAADIHHNNMLLTIVALISWSSLATSLNRPRKLIKLNITGILGITDIPAVLHVAIKNENYSTSRILAIVCLLGESNNIPLSYHSITIVSPWET